MTPAVVSRCHIYLIFTKVSLFQVLMQNCFARSHSRSCHMARRAEVSKSGGCRGCRDAESEGRPVNADHCKLLSRKRRRRRGRGVEGAGEVASNLASSARSPPITTDHVIVVDYVYLPSCLWRQSSRDGNKLTHGCWIGQQVPLKTLTLYTFLIWILPLWWRNGLDWGLALHLSTVRGLPQDACWPASRPYWMQWVRSYIAPILLLPPWDLYQIHYRMSMTFSEQRKRNIGDRGRGGNCPNHQPKSLPFAHSILVRKERPIPLWESLHRIASLHCWGVFQYIYSSWNFKTKFAIYENKIVRWQDKHLQLLIICQTLCKIFCITWKSTAFQNLSGSIRVQDIFFVLPNLQNIWTVRMQKLMINHILEYSK